MLWSSCAKQVLLDCTSGTLLLGSIVILTNLVGFLIVLFDHTRLMGYIYIKAMFSGY